MTINGDRLKHFIWCVRNQMEKCWDFREELAEALEHYEQLRSESKWVKVSDRLPDSPRDVDVCEDYGSIGGGQCVTTMYRSQGEWKCRKRAVAPEYITHWRERPSSPKEVSDAQVRRD